MEDKGKLGKEAKANFEVILDQNKISMNIKCDNGIIRLKYDGEYNDSIYKKVKNNLLRQNDYEINDGEVLIDENAYNKLSHIEKIDGKFDAKNYITDIND